MSNARLEHYLRTQVRTYRVALSDLATDTGNTAKIAVEVFGVANKHVKLRHVQVAKPSLAIAPFQLNKYSVGSTGSTGQSLASPLLLSGPAGSSYGGNVRLYTVNPSSTAGTLVDQAQEIDIATTDVMNEHYGDDQGKFAPTLYGSTESYAMVITSTGANTLNGYIEITEEP